MEFREPEEWSFWIRAQLLPCSNSGLLSLVWVPQPICRFLSGNFLNVYWFWVAFAFFLPKFCILKKYKQEFRQSNHYEIKSTTNRRLKLRNLQVTWPRWVFVFMKIKWNTLAEVTDINCLQPEFHCDFQVNSVRIPQAVSWRGEWIRERPVSLRLNQAQYHYGFLHFFGFFLFFLMYHGL